MASTPTIKVNKCLKEYYFVTDDNSGIKKIEKTKCPGCNRDIEEFFIYCPNCGRMCLIIRPTAPELINKRKNFDHAGLVILKCFAMIKGVAGRTLLSEILRGVESKEKYNNPYFGFLRGESSGQALALIDKLVSICYLEINQVMMNGFSRPMLKLTNLGLEHIKLDKDVDFEAIAININQKQQIKINNERELEQKTNGADTNRLVNGSVKLDDSYGYERELNETEMKKKKDYGAYFDKYGFMISLNYLCDGEKLNEETKNKIIKLYGEFKLKGSNKKNVFLASVKLAMEMEGHSVLRQNDIMYRQNTTAINRTFREMKRKLGITNCVPCLKSCIHSVLERLRDNKIHLDIEVLETKSDELYREFEVKGLMSIIGGAPSNAAVSIVYLASQHTSSPLTQDEVGHASSITKATIRNVIRKFNQSGKLKNWFKIKKFKQRGKSKNWFNNPSIPPYLISKTEPIKTEPIKTEPIEFDYTKNDEPQKMGEYTKSSELLANEEEKELIKYFNEGKSISEISIIMRWHPDDIRSRLKKLGLIEPGT